jgi:hypothetical protein
MRKQSAVRRDYDYDYDCDCDDQACLTTYVWMSLSP